MPSPVRPLPQPGRGRRPPGGAAAGELIWSPSGSPQTAGGTPWWRAEKPPFEAAGGFPRSRSGEPSCLLRHLFAAWPEVALLSSSGSSFLRVPGSGQGAPPPPPARAAAHLRVLPAASPLREPLLRGSGSYPLPLPLVSATARHQRQDCLGTHRRLPNHNGPPSLFSTPTPVHQCPLCPP